MEKDSRIFLLTADLGYGILDEIRRDFPERAINTGACEQLMLGTAVGMAHNGFLPVCYSITPFVIFRPFEILRNYLDHEGTNVKLVGAGRDRDYGHCGFSHWAEDDVTVLKTLPKIEIFKPTQLDQDVFEEFLNHTGPAYLNLAR